MQSAAPAPPLPPGPPPTAAHATPTQWVHDGLTTQWQNEIPAISALLMREADAWRALLALHASTLQSAQALAKPTTPDASLTREEMSSSSEAREASYCSALTQLAHSADSLLTEAMKLRALRRARRSVEVDALREVLRVHSDESLAVGQHLASNCSMNVSNATSDMRVCVQQQRTQVSQLRSMLEVLRTAQNLPLPANTKLVVGLQTDDFVDARPVEDLMNAVYENAREINETSLSEALGSLFVGEARKEEQPRNFARRGAKKA